MSDIPPSPSPPFPPAPTPPPSSGWGAPVISVYSLTLLVVALAFAYLTKNDNLLVMLAGVVATNATACVSFYVGSSRGSQTKDNVIAMHLSSLNTNAKPAGNDAHGV